MKSKVLMALLCLCMLMSGVSAFDFDNVKSYDADKKEVTITNLFGLGSDIAKIKLNSPLNVYVIAGKNRMVAEFELNVLSEYDNPLESIKFINLINSKETTRTFTYKYKVLLKERNVTDFKQECHDVDDSLNVSNPKGTKPVCTYKEIGSHMEYDYEWKDVEVEKLASFPIGTYTIGIFTDVYSGDVIEWIPTFYGFDIDEWATWTENFNNGLVYYYNFSSRMETVNRVNNLSFSEGTPTFVAEGIVGQGGNTSVNNDFNITDASVSMNIRNRNTSLNVWVRRGTADGYIFNFGSVVWYLYSDATGLQESTICSGNPNFPANLVANTWYMISFITNDTGTALYMNGVYNYSCNVNADATASELDIGHRDKGTELLATFDELGFWNRPLTTTELTDLYNGGSGISYTPPPPPSGGVVVDLNFPVADYITRYYYVNFSANVTSIRTFNNTNITLWIWNGTNTILNNSYTNTLSGNGTNISYFYNLILYEGFYKWNAFGCGTNISDFINCTFDPTNRTFSIDLTPPNITIINISIPPNAKRNYSSAVLPINVTFNMTFNDTYSSVDSCRYSIDKQVTNISFVCGSLFNVTLDKPLKYPVNVWSNNTAGLWGNKTAIISVMTYDSRVNLPIIAGGNVATFYLTLNATDIQMNLGNATLKVNNTLEAGAVLTSSMNYTIYSASVTIPTSWGNTSGKWYSWNWSVNTDEFGSFITLNESLKVVSLGVDNCSIYDVMIFNITSKDEESLANINSTIEVDLNLTTTGGETVSFHKKITETDSPVNSSNLLICINNVTSYTNLTAYMVGRFDSSTRVNEFYYIDNLTIGQHNIPQIINFMDLALTDSTSFLFDFRDEDDLEVPEAIVHVYRYYIGEGLYREVERAKQDDNGETLVHLVEEDVVYKFVITLYGTTIFTSTPYTAKCPTGTCTISMSAQQGDTNWTSIDNEGKYFVVTSSKTAKQVTLTYKGLPYSQLVNFSLYNFTQGRYTRISSTFSNATSGVLTLNIPVSTYNNGTYFVTIFSDYNFIRSEWVDMSINARDYWGTTGIILTGFMIMTLSLMAVSEGIGLIVFSLLGVFIGGALKLIELNWVVLISLIIGGGVIVYKIATRRTPQ